jgi:hypothetical protein
MTNEQQRSPIFCLDKLKKHLYNTIWGIKQLLTSMGKLGREKKETKEGEKVAPAKATFRVSKTKNSFFWFTSIGVLRDPSRLKYCLLRYFFYAEAMCEGSSENRLLNAAKAVP